MTAYTCYLEPYRILDAQNRVEIFGYIKICKTFQIFRSIFFDQKLRAPLRSAWQQRNRRSFFGKFRQKWTSLVYCTTRTNINWTKKDRPFLPPNLCQSSPLVKAHHATPENCKLNGKSRSLRRLAESVFTTLKNRILFVCVYLFLRGDTATHFSVGLYAGPHFSNTPPPPACDPLIDTISLVR